MERSGQDSASDTSVDERRKTVREERKVRRKKRKRKRDLIDIRQRLSKPKKKKRQQSNFVKLVEGFDDLRKEYEKQTKIDRNSKKPQSMKTLATRILPKPLTGIYRNGALGKTIRKSQTNPAMGDTGNARLEGDMCKLLNGYDSKSESIVVGNTNEKEPNPKNILIPYSSDESTSPFLGRMDGGNKCKMPEEPRATDLSKSSNHRIDSREYYDTAMKRYQELCQSISRENFEENNFKFPGEDPLTKVKKRLRNAYARSFRYQIMRDVFKDDDAPVCSTSTSSSTFYSPAAKQNNPFLFTAEDVQNQKYKEDGRTDLPSTTDTLKNKNNLFDSSEIRDASSHSLVEPQTNESYNVRSSLELNHSISSILRNNNDLKFFEVDTKEKNKPVPPMPEQSKPVYRKHIRKEKNPHEHVINSKVKKYSGVQNLKTNKYQMNPKNLKYIPTMLRKNEVDDGQNVLDLSSKSFEMSANVVFTPPVVSKAAEDFAFDPKNARTCVEASPSARNDDKCFMKDRKAKQKPQVHQSIFTQKNNNPVQKTVMLTKKDSINVGQFLYMNRVVNSESRENPNVCIIRKNVPERENVCVIRKNVPEHENVCNVHRNCQRVPGTCYREFKCSQNSEVSQPNCSSSSQEFREGQNAPINQAIPEEDLLRGMHKCDHTCNDVCYVVFDQCKHGNAQEYSNNNRTRQLQGRLSQEDVGILNGVQNLKLIKEREVRSRENAMLLEHQPIKYLAFNDDSNTKKIPIYLHNKCNVEVIDPSVNYRLVSCPKEPAKEVIFVPTCESDKVLYVKPNVPNASHEEYSHPTKMVLVKEPSSNVCEIHVPKQNIMEIRNPEYNVVTNCVDNKKRRVNWEQLNYQHHYEHDVCLQNPTIYYKK